MSNLLPYCQLQKEEGPLDSENVRCLLAVYCTHIYTNISWLHKCATWSRIWGKSEVQNIHNFNSVKYYKHLTKQYYSSFLQIKISSTG